MSLSSLQKKKWKHMWISHSIPFSASHSQPFRQSKAVLQHQYRDKTRSSDDICASWIHVGHYWEPWARYTGWNINRTTTACMKGNESYRERANSTSIPHLLQADAASRTSDLNCFQIRDLHMEQARRFSKWHIFSSEWYSMTGAWISNVHKILQAL